jgi:hypothetical protein
MWLLVCTSRHHDKDSFFSGSTRPFQRDGELSGAARDEQRCDDSSAMIASRAALRIGSHSTRGPMPPGARAAGARAAIALLILALAQ